MRDVTPRGSKTICIAFSSEALYHECMEDGAQFRAYLDVTYAAHPELFPPDFAGGYKLHGYMHSKKQAITLRRIRLQATAEAYQIRPSFLMPYMVARTAEVEKGLYLRRWGVPFEALTYVLGRNPMFWYRAYTNLGRYSLVGTTIKDAARLPTDVLADEKHTRLKGAVRYLATTVAQGCILGVELAEQANTANLKQAYQVFKTEAQRVAPDYAPQTVNTDGWRATQNAWRALFPAIVIILCFLHAYLKIKDRVRHAPDQLRVLATQVWHAYHAATLPQFAQRIRRLREWAHTQLSGTVQTKVLDLCAQAALFKLAYQYPTAYRTSNALDRLMDYQDRLLYTMRYFHGTPTAARWYARAMALVWNFHPYGRQTQTKYQTQHASPFSRLNGRHYHDNWLQNLLIAASLQGC